jgi:pimeloyl-ACP methyl ester carboxylesterase
MADMAADAAAVLDAAKIERAHVFGISMGGLIAQELALQSPGRVRSLVLGCTGCGGPRVVRAEKAAFDMLTARGMSMEEHITAAVPYLYNPETQAARIEEDLAIRRQNVPSAEAFQAQLYAILSWQSYDRLPQIRIPTLVIHGEADLLVPPGNARLVAERIPGARLAMLPQAAHLFTTDQPEASHKAILGFLLDPANCT